MVFTRRNLLAASGSLAGYAALQRLGVAQVVAADATAAPMPKTAAAKALYADVGPAAWAELYRKLRTANSDLADSGMRHIRGVNATLLTGYPYNEFYDWDLYFENMYLSYYGVWPLCYTNLKEFLDRQQPDGYISRSLIKQRDKQHFKPFMAQLVVLGARQDKDNYEWLRGNYYGRLKKYVDKWFSYDADKNGLPVWNSADAAGTDNQWSRGGALNAFEIEGVDLASYLIRELRAMNVIATHLGEKADAAAFTKHADAVVKLINANMWDEKMGMYLDRNEKTGQLVQVKSGTSFAVLYAGAATPERAKRMIHEHMLNPAEFWLEYPIASYAKTEPDYYQGSHHECNWRGSTWAPINYMAFQGLQDYGYHTEARELARRLFQMAVVKNPVLREYYNAETGDGLGQTHFWGFTALYYGMLLESYANYDAASLTKPFRKLIPEELGLEFPALPVMWPEPVVTT
jgi:putative isomerase